MASDALTLGGAVPEGVEATAKDGASLSPDPCVPHRAGSGRSDGRGAHRCPQRQERHPDPWPGAAIETGAGSEPRSVTGFSTPRPTAPVSRSFTRHGSKRRERTPFRPTASPFGERSAMTTRFAGCIGPKTSLWSRGTVLSDLGGRPTFAPPRSCASVCSRGPRRVGRTCITHRSSGSPAQPGRRTGGRAGPRPSVSRRAFFHWPVVTNPSPGIVLRAQPLG